MLTLIPAGIHNCLMNEYLTKTVSLVRLQGGREIVEVKHSTVMYIHFPCILAVTLVSLRTHLTDCSVPISRQINSYINGNVWAILV